MPAMLWMGVEQGGEGDTEIAPPSSASILEPLRTGAFSGGPFCDGGRRECGLWAAVTSIEMQ